MPLRGRALAGATAPCPPTGATGSARATGDVRAVRNRNGRREANALAEPVPPGRARQCWTLPVPPAVSLSRGLAGPSTPCSSSGATGFASAGVTCELFGAGTVLGSRTHWRSQCHPKGQGAVGPQQCHPSGSGASGRSADAPLPPAPATQAEEGSGRRSAPATRPADAARSRRAARRGEGIPPSVEERPYAVSIPPPAREAPRSRGENPRRPRTDGVGQVFIGRHSVLGHPVTALTLRSLLPQPHQRKKVRPNDRPQLPARHCVPFCPSHPS